MAGQLPPPVEALLRRRAIRRPGRIPGVEGAMPPPPKVPVERILDFPAIVGGARG